MNDIRTNTSDVVVEPNRERLRTLTVETNAQTSIPIVDVMLPSGWGDHIIIPHVNLSISGYEPDLLRTSNMRSPSMQDSGNFNDATIGWTWVSSNERSYWNEGHMKFLGQLKMRILSRRHIYTKDYHY